MAFNQQTGNVTNNAPLGQLGQPVLYGTIPTTASNVGSPFSPQSLFPPWFGAAGGGMGQALGGALFNPGLSGSAAPPAGGSGISAGNALSSPASEFVPPSPPMPTEAPPGGGGFQPAPGYGPPPGPAQPMGGSVINPATGQPAPQTAGGNVHQPGMGPPPSGGSGAVSGGTPDTVFGGGAQPNPGLMPGGQGFQTAPLPQGVLPWLQSQTGGSQSGSPGSPSMPPGSLMPPGYGAPPGPGADLSGNDPGYNPNLFNQIASGAPAMGWGGAFTSGYGPSVPAGGGGFGGGYGGGGFGAGAPSFGTGLPGSLGGGGGGGAFKPPPAPNFGGTGGGNNPLQFGGPGTAQQPGTLPGSSSGLLDSTFSHNPLSSGPYQSTDPNAPNYTTPALAAQYNSQLGGQQGGSGSTGTTAPNGVNANTGLVQALGGSQQGALNDANAANLALLQSVLGGYGSLGNQLTGTLGQTTAQGFTNLLNQFRQNIGASDQSLTDRGLGNSTIVDAVNNGIRSNYLQNANALTDQRLQELLGIQQGIGQGQLNALSSVNATPPDQGMLAQLTQGVGASGANPSISGLGGSGVAGTQTGDFGSMLSNFLSGGTGIGGSGGGNLGGFLFGNPSGQGGGAPNPLGNGTVPPTNQVVGGAGGIAVRGGGAGPGGPIQASTTFTGAPNPLATPNAGGAGSRAGLAATGSIPHSMVGNVGENVNGHYLWSSGANYGHPMQFTQGAPTTSGGQSLLSSYADLSPNSSLPADMQVQQSLSTLIQNNPQLVNGPLQGLNLTNLDAMAQVLKQNPALAMAWQQQNQQSAATTNAFNQLAAGQISPQQYSTQSYGR